MDDELAAFVRTRYRDLVRRGYLLTGDRGRAEDLVQEALMRCCRAWRKNEVVNADAYLHRTMVNLAISHSRLRRVREQATAHLPETAVSDGSDERAERDWLWGALLQTPMRQRAVLVLRFYDGLGEREIAEVLDVSVGTVRSQTAKAIARLRRARSNEKRLEGKP